MAKLAGLLLIFVSAVAQAQQLAPHEYYILGHGVESCGVWLETRSDKSARLQRGQWLLGYLSGYNSQTTASGQVRIQDWQHGESALAFVDRYCSSNPLSNVGAGAAALVESLGGRKADHPWKR